MKFRVLLCIAVTLVAVGGGVAGAAKGGGGGGGGPKPKPTATPRPVVADLQVVGITENIDPFVADLHPDESLVYTTTLRNNGPDPVTAVWVRGILQGGGPGGVVVTSPQGGCTITQRPVPASSVYDISCELGSLRADPFNNQMQFDITVGLNCEAAGSVHVSTLVYDNFADDANDTGSQETSVVGPIFC